jgi:hypothetical protein
MPYSSYIKIGKYRE